MSKKKIKRKQAYKRPQDPTFKEWWQAQPEKNRKGLIRLGIILLAVIVLALVYYYGVYDDGSLRVSRGAIVGAQENWLIGERAKGKNSAYYHIADVEAPEGFTRGEDAVMRSTSSLRQDFTFYDGGDPEIMLYVAPVNNDAASMLDSIYSTFAGMTAERGAITEVGTVETSLGTCQYFEYHYAFDDEDMTELYSQALVCYAPSRYKDGCILVSANVTPATADGYYTTEELLSAVVSAIDRITLVTK